MITKLHIENYILIDSLDIDIERGLNTVTGETGAGKSILLGAISLLLGSRGDASLIKKGAKNLIIEAEFNTERVEQQLRPLFESEQIEYNTNITIRRLITESGKSKNYIDDEPVSQSFLKEIGSFLVDIHSQHQTLLLSNKSFQTDILDSMSGAKDSLMTYKQTFQKITELKGDIERLKTENEKSKRDRDYIEFQFEQLSDANLKEEEKDELELERDMLSNAAAIGEALYKSTNLLYGGDDNIISSLQIINSTINKISGFLTDGNELQNRINSIVIEAKDINREIEHIATKIEDNPKRLAEIENRLDTLMTLEQKHSVSSTIELINIREEFKSKIGELDNIEQIITTLEKELSEVEKKGWEQAIKIQKLRLASSDKLAASIVKNLIQLGMPNAHLKIDVSPKDTLSENGADDITFLFSANGATNLEKIDKVASGGEMSRLMLSLKAIASHNAAMPTIIFDEIDSGVSGKVADQMGRIMEELAQNIQIINITHLPQVASKGDHHFYVYKEHKEGQSISHIIKLNEQQRINEIAVMLSGSNITDAALAQAKTLLNKN